jgi:hypothetical protein
MDNESFMEIDGFGNKSWKNKKNQFHRIGGPAFEYANGDKFWFQNDEYHRLDGPAVEGANGYKEWCKNGKTHRLDGPAKQWPSGEKEWYNDGKRFKSKDTFFRSLSKKEKEIALFSEDFLNG